MSEPKYISAVQKVQLLKAEVARLRAVVAAQREALRLAGEAFRDCWEYEAHELDDVTGQLHAVTPRAKRVEAALNAIAALDVEGVSEPGVPKGSREDAPTGVKPPAPGSLTFPVDTDEWEPHYFALQNECEDLRAVVAAQREALREIVDMGDVVVGRPIWWLVARAALDVEGVSEPGPPSQTLDARAGIGVDDGGGLPPGSLTSPVDRNPTCVEAWPECYVGGYDPRCCRFPKSCSCWAVTSPVDGNTGFDLSGPVETTQPKPGKSHRLTSPVDTAPDVVNCAECGEPLALGHDCLAGEAYWEPFPATPEEPT